MMASWMRKHVRVSEPESEDTSAQTDSEGRNDAESSDDEEAEDDNGGGADKDDNSNPNAGWAEAMAKIIGKKTLDSTRSNIIMKKNKDLGKEKKREQNEQLERRKQVDRRQAWEMMCREKPNMVKNREAERALQRIATRGVVQLFNAVRKHQKTMDDKVKEVGGSERKRAKVLCSVSKRDFIDVLRRTEEGSGDVIRSEWEEASGEKPDWSVLRDDFMMSATMKDWDKESDKEEAEVHRGVGGGRGT
ncbi:RRP15-like protein [Echeneis naucrates]|uniref:RRP15-like protein n=1 Tax=Echeneis naucrates TaxID=173247 RepID=A0A665T4I9_ECHNA|nr:RRP15-like protein [Echeneis naucrates]